MHPQTDRAPGGEKAMTERDEVRKEVWGDLAGDITPGEVVLAVETPEREPEIVETPEPTAEEAPPDPWEGVSQSVKDRIETLSKQVSDFAKMEHRLRQAESRVGNLQTELSKRDAEKLQRENELRSESRKAEKAKLDKKWAEAKELIDPDLADAMERKIAHAADELEEKIQGLKAPGPAVDPNEVESRIADMVEERIVSFAYPGYREKILADSGFWGWLNSQPANIKGLANSKKADDAIAVFDAYSDFLKPSATVTSREKRLKQAESPKTVPQSTIKSEDTMTLDEYRDHVRKQIYR